MAHFTAWPVRSNQKRRFLVIDLPDKVVPSIRYLSEPLDPFGLSRLYKLLI
jgi:hypothetical protein